MCTFDLEEDEYGWPDEFFRLNVQRFTDLLPLVSPETFETFVREVYEEFHLDQSVWTCHLEWIRAALAFHHNRELPRENFLLNRKDYDTFFEKHIDEFLALSEKDDWRPFLERMPGVLANHMIRQVNDKMIVQGMGATINPKLRNYLLEKYRQNPANTVQDIALVEQQFAFYCDFLQKGQPKKLLTEWPTDSKYAYVLQAIISMSEGQEPEKALAYMKKALACEGKKRYFAEPVLNWYYGVALLRDRDNPASVKKMSGLSELKAVRTAPGFEAFYLLTAIGGAVSLDGTTHAIWNRLNDVEGEFSAGQGLYLISAQAFGVHDNSTRTFERKVGSFFERFPILKLEYLLVKGETAEFETLIKAFGINPILPIVREKPLWEKTLIRLLALENTRAPAKKSGKVGSLTRYAYFFNEKDFEIQIRQQKSKDGGVTWDKGKEVSFTTFKKGNAAMTEQDHRVRATLDVIPGYTSRLEMNVFEAIFALEGCQNVFDAHQETRRIEIRSEPLQITVKKTKDNFVVSTNLPKGFNADTWGSRCWNSTDPGLISLFRLNSQELDLLRELQTCSEYPLEAEGKLKEFLELLSRSTSVQSDLLSQSTALKQLNGDARIVFQIQPFNGEFSVSALVKPVLSSTTTCEPGVGVDCMTMTLDGKPVQVTRDRQKERENFEKIATALESIDSCRDGEHSWTVDTANCLMLLEVLRVHSDIAVVEWPQGAKLKVTKGKLNPADLQLSVRSMGHWFTLEGNIKLDAKTVLTVAELLEKIREAKGNFIQLSETEYVALTEQLKKDLSALDSLATRDRKKGALKVSKFNADRLDKLGEEGLNLDADEGFQDLTARIKATEALDVKVPAGLKAELRDYQFDGFEWLTKLSNWGAGALLADDMGLGKTVQTIAFLLEQAKKGPALVVVPTAVVGNWVDELKRFSPSLNPVVYTWETKEARAKLLTKLQAGDVVLVTYGVLTGDIEDFAKVTWTTAVLDEAHAIKNRDTKMSHAVMQLTADARVMLTGTPLQNHLSELWNLFEFANPGFLGSFDEFSQRYVIPVEKNKDRERQRALKRLISPFILRRTKSEVVQELPEKTEITLRVKLSDDEMALYDRLREQAAVNLETGEINPIEALAELMRLRQAACSPALVDASLKDMGSSKTEAFVDLVDDLIEGNHRALVFSQFTSHLALIKEALDVRGIEYLYLDGSMTSTQRTKLVEKFQKGEMPLFLISLKAGGTGLNL
ncbi:MAG: DEAD/DEAH box helicase, partial [Sutterellaceae bacterium]|nr:DEAD/DEAH box helicase [Sutterellaceae bacterium]